MIIRGKDITCLPAGRFRDGVRERSGGMVGGDQGRRDGFERLWTNCFTRLGGFAESLFQSAVGSIYRYAESRSWDYGY